MIYIMLFFNKLLKSMIDIDFFMFINFPF
jgi:hypothetical protein